MQRQRSPTVKEIEYRSPETDKEYEEPEDFKNVTNEEVTDAVEGDEEAEAVEGEEEAEAEVAEGEEETEADEEEESVDGGCGQYTAQIWDTTFANPNAVTLSDLLLDTAVEMSSDPVCSDTIRYTYKTVETLLTSPGARYTMTMLLKLLWSVSKKQNYNKGLGFKETTKVVNRLLNEQPVQDMFVTAVTGIVKLYQDPVVHERMARLIKVYGSRFKSTMIAKLNNRKNMKTAQKRKTYGGPTSKRF